MTNAEDQKHIDLVSEYLALPSELLTVGKASEWRKQAINKAFLEVVLYIEELKADKDAADFTMLPIHETFDISFREAIVTRLRNNDYTVTATLIPERNESMYHITWNFLPYEKALKNLRMKLHQQLQQAIIRGERTLNFQIDCTCGCDVDQARRILIELGKEQTDKKFNADLQQTGYNFPALVLDGWANEN